MRMHKYSVYIVDVCGSLVSEDTTIGFLRHHFSRNPKHRYRCLLLSALTSAYSPLRIILFVLEKLSRRHILKHLAVRLLAGEKMKALLTSADEYVSCLLSNRCIYSVRQLLKTIAPDRLFLASASVDPVVATLARDLGVRYVASTLELRDGVLTGRYAKDLTGQKEVALADKYGNDILAKSMCVITDNLTDWPLLELASCAYVVLHSKRYRRRWNGLNASFLDGGATCAWHT